MGAHGVPNHCRNVLELRGALQKLAGHSLIQLSAPSDDFTQDNLLKLGAEGVVHCFIRDHHCPWSQTWRRHQAEMLIYLFQKNNSRKRIRKNVLTDSTGCSKAKQDHVTALSVVQQFDEFMQHDGDGRDAHAMLWWKQNQDRSYFRNCGNLRPAMQYLKHLPVEINTPWTVYVIVL